MFNKSRDKWLMLEAKLWKNKMPRQRMMDGKANDFYPIMRSLLQRGCNVLERIYGQEHSYIFTRLTWKGYLESR